MIRKLTRTIFIEAGSGTEFEQLLNEKLKGLSEPTIQIFGKYQGAIIYTERIFEDEEEAVNCSGKCGECPFFKKPTDKRFKYFACKKANRKVTEASTACNLFPTERREEIVSNIGTENERKEMGHENPVFMFEDRLVESLSQKERGHSILDIGNGYPIKGNGNPCNRSIQGG